MQESIIENVQSIIALKKKYIYIHIFDNHKHKLVCCLFNNLIIKEKREFD